MQFEQELKKENLDPGLKEKIDHIINKDRIVLFMKGTKEFPQCGFSDTVVKVLNFYGADFVAYDVLTNPDLRSGMKLYSEYATFPQLYIDQELMGGRDAVMRMHENGQMQSALEQ